MGQFKPMVKMFTDEPSVILKLKKGGNVKAVGKADDFKSMSQTSGGNPFAASEKGKAPKKPSIMHRHKAMNPNMYARGGKVVHKQMGGMMPGGASALGGMAPMGSGAAMRPMNRAALAGMAPAARMARAAQVRRALMGMKKGGSPAAECAKLERELKHHEAMSAARAHGKASGGKIDAAETRTTLKNSVNRYAKTKMDTAKKDKAHGTGEVKEGKPGGYAMGGSIMGNEGPFKNTKMVSAGKGKTNGTTGGVRMSNAGGYKHGGKAMKYASGGAVDNKMTHTTVKGGNWENRPANTSKPGKTNTKTGEVKKANAGGYNRGGRASKKSFATGGQVVDDGKAVKYPRHFVSRPVANSLQSGTFNRGGKVEKEEKPNLRLVKTHTGPKGHVAKVYKDRDWNEYRVKFFSPEGKHHANADFHSDDIEDAHDTATSQVNKGYKRGGNVKMARGGTPLKYHPYHNKTDAELRYIIKDASEAARAMRGMNEKAESKYLDQANDANTVLGYRQRQGKSSKYGDGGNVPSDDVEDKYAPWSKEKSEAYKKSLPMASRSDLEARLSKSANAKKMGSYIKELDRQESSFNPRYSEAAVNKAIASSNRSGRKISNKEAKSIHRLLKGRYADGGKVSMPMRQLYAQTYMKHGKTAKQSDKAVDKAYDAVKSRFGDEAVENLRQYHEKNRRGYQQGGNVPLDIEDQRKTAENERGYRNWERIQRKENEADLNMIPDAMKRVADKVKGFFSSSKPPEGSVTKTEKSVTVSPAKKRGGSMKF